MAERTAQPGVRVRLPAVLPERLADVENVTLPLMITGVGARRRRGMEVLTRLELDHKATAKATALTTSPCAAVVRSPCATDTW
ncbi:MAG: hypothetical protein ABWX59_10045 [Microbacteriaceae bacterium]